MKVNNEKHTIYIRVKAVWRFNSFDKKYYEH